MIIKTLRIVHAAQQDASALIIHLTGLKIPTFHLSSHGLLLYNKTTVTDFSIVYSLSILPFYPVILIKQEAALNDHCLLSFLKTIYSFIGFPVFITVLLFSLFGSSKT